MGVSLAGAGAVLGYFATVYKRTWRGTVVASFVNPLFFLLAMGVGLGSLVRESGPDPFAGVSYLQFVAPALLATTAMQTASVEAAWPVLGNIKYTRTYFAMLATPIGVAEIVAGHLGWVALRLVQSCTAYFLVMTAFGATHSAWGVLAIPASVATGMAFAAPLFAFSARLDRESSLVALQRFGIVPLFLFSGTFFPITELPLLLQPIAYATPLWHGVDLCRDAALGDLDAASAGVHVAYLTAWFAIGVALACRSLRRRVVV